MENPPAKMLVTGSGGQLGSEIVEHLKHKFDVIAADRALLDITDASLVQATLEKSRPSVVVHCAAWTDVDECERDPQKAMRVNADGTANVATACKACGALMVYISTDYVFDGTKKEPYVETDRPSPLSAYGKSKLAGEVAVQSILADYVILRTSWVYGSTGRNFVQSITRIGKQQLADRREGRQVIPIRVVADQVGCPTRTVDIAKQLVVILDSKMRGIVHVSNGGQVSWYQFTREIFERLQLEVLVEPCTTEELARPAPRPRYSALENRRLINAGLNIMPTYRDSLYTFLDEQNKATV